uniref:RRM domain-containing protein n=1 Tax=Clastoptera arizonana TaxID=38151 RepID=A0A1B6CVG5_9HEMI
MSKVLSPPDSSELDDNWNPIKEDFYNLSFNSYDVGPGADLDLHLQTVNKRFEEPRSYKLFIGNIPQGFTKKGLQNIFENFGTINSTHIGSSKLVSTYSFGLVVYDSLSNAQNAIKELHNQPPFNFKVKFAKSQKERDQLKDDEEILKSVTREGKYEEEEREVLGRTIKSFKGLLPENILSEEKIVDSVLDYSLYNHYSGENSSDLTHRVYTQITLNYSKEQSYMLPDVNNTYPQVLTPVSVLPAFEITETVGSPSYNHNKRINVYEHGAKIGDCEECAVCGIETVNKLKICEKKISGTRCLLEHWPEHTTICMNSSYEDNGLEKNQISKHYQDLANIIKHNNDILINPDEPKCILSLLKEGVVGCLQIRERLSKCRFLCILACMDYPSTLGVFKDDLYKASNNEPYIPKIGELVAVNSNIGGIKWGRGFVFRKGEVVLCDFGHRIKFETAIKLSQELKSSPKLAVYCEVLDDLDDFFKEFSKENVNLEFTVGTCSKDGTVSAVVKICGRAASTLATVRFSPFFVFGQLELKNDTDVVLTAFYNCATLYVQSVEQKSAEILGNLMQDLQVHCLSEEPLEDSPVLGDMVAVCKNTDDIWYRGQVLRKENEREAFQVILVDYGIISSVPLSNMKNLNSALKSVPCCGIRVGLADIEPNTVLKLEVLNFIKNMCRLPETLSLKFKVDNDLSSVILLRKGNSLNEEIKILNVPDWMNIEEMNKIESSEKCLDEDMLKCTLVAGKKYKLLLSFMPSVDYMNFCSISSDVGKHVLNVLPHQLKEYYTNTKQKAYNPRVGELCIVYLEDVGCWYRAVCLSEVIGLSESGLNFIDFGCVKYVPTKFIRKFCTDFLVAPALMLACNYKVLENCTDICKIRAEELIERNVEYEIDVIKQSEIDSTYDIDIPCITVKLREEGLLPNVECK